MVCTRENIKSNGLNVWSDEAGSSRSPKVDIIAVQNLGEHPYDTWVKKVPSGTAPEPQRLRDRFSRLKIGKGKQREQEVEEHSYTETMWLRDLLAPSIEDARVASYSYKPDWGYGDVKVSLHRCAENFLRALLDYRRQDETPIILIGHGTGNLVIQQALNLAIDQKTFPKLVDSVTGVIFLGTPFQARTDVEFKEWLAMLNIQDEALSKLLVQESPELCNMVRKFWGKSSRWEVACFNEKPKDGISLIKAEILSRQTESMDKLLLKILDIDYSSLNKFGGHHDESFKSILAEIQRMVDCGLLNIAERSRSEMNKNNRTKSRTNVHWTVPKPVNDLFIGRDDILSQMHHAFSDDNPPLDKQKRFVITGLGGQGKSEICLKFANLEQNKFWAVFWVDVGDPATAESGFTDLATRIGRSAGNVSEALQVVATLEEKWLLILDNADNPKFDYQIYIPPVSRGAVLITSRVPRCERYNTVGAVALEGLEGKLPVELLLRAADIERDKWPVFASQAKAIVEILGSHTLALVQAGAYIANGHCQMHEYPEVFQEEGRKLLKFHEKQAQSRYSNVYATFEASARVLEQAKSEEAEDALQLVGILSMLTSSFLPLQIFEMAWGGVKEYSIDSVPEYGDIGYMTQEHVSHLPDFIVVNSEKWRAHRVNAATSVLSSLSLVKRHELKGSIGISMHPLAHAWAKERQNPKQVAQFWITAGCVVMFAAIHNNEWRGMEQTLLPHVWSFINVELAKIFSFGSREFIAAILISCCWSLLNSRQDARVQDFLARLGDALNFKTDDMAQSFPLLAVTVGQSFTRLGKSKEAAELLEQVLRVLGAKLPANHSLLHSLQHNLAAAYLTNGQATEAVTLFQQVVQPERATRSESHPSLLASQHGLAQAYLAKKQVPDALELFKKVVRIREEIMSEDHPDLLTSQHELARAYLENKQVSDALELLKQIVRIREGILSVDHSDLLVSQHLLADAYLENEQVSEALELFKRIVRIKKGIMSEDHPSRLASQHELARAYYLNGQSEEAIELFRHVVRIRQTSLPENHPNRIGSEKWLAFVLSQTGGD